METLGADDVQRIGRKISRLQPVGAEDEASRSCQDDRKNGKKYDPPISPFDTGRRTSSN
jgi:hypothetical protein